MADREARVQNEKARAIAWLNEKWKGSKACPICLTDKWSPTEVLEMRQHEGGNMIIGGGSSLYPLFQILCTNCGYVHMFNAVISGVLDQAAQPDERTDG